MSAVLQCLVIDDEPIARQGLANYVEQTPFLRQQGSCKNALEASQLLQQERIDLILLDIQMPGITGLDFLKSLRNPPLVIFTTAYREYALEGYELNIVDYLVKPISYPRFLKAAHKAYEIHQHQHAHAGKQDSGQDYFFIKSDHKYLKIFFQDILFVEGLKDYVFIHTQSEKLLTLISLKNVEQELPADNFARVHRSYIVALDKVEALEGNQLRIQEHLVPISRAHKEELYERLIKGRLWKR